MGDLLTVLFVSMFATLVRCNTTTFGLLQILPQGESSGIETCRWRSSTRPVTLNVTSAVIATMHDDNDTIFKSISDLRGFEFNAQITATANITTTMQPTPCFRTKALNTLYLSFLNRGSDQSKKSPKYQLQLSILSNPSINWDQFSKAWNSFSVADRSRIIHSELNTDENSDELEQLLYSNTSAQWYLDYQSRKEQAPSNIDYFDVAVFWKLYLMRIYQAPVALAENDDWMSYWSPKEWGFKDDGNEMKVDNTTAISLDQTQLMIPAANLTSGQRYVVKVTSKYNDTLYHGWSTFDYVPLHSQRNMLNFIEPARYIILDPRSVVNSSPVKLVYDFSNAFWNVKPAFVRCSYEGSQVDELEFSVDEIAIKNLKNPNDPMFGPEDWTAYLDVELYEESAEVVSKGSKPPQELVEEPPNGCYGFDGITREWRYFGKNGFGEYTSKPQVSSDLAGTFLLPTPCTELNMLLAVKIELIFSPKVILSTWDWVHVIGAAELRKQGCGDLTQWDQVEICLAPTEPSQNDIKIQCNEYSCRGNGACSEDGCTCNEGFKGRICSYTDEEFAQQQSNIDMAILLAQEQVIIASNVDSYLRNLEYIIRQTEFLNDQHYGSLLDILTAVQGYLQTSKSLKQFIRVCQFMQSALILQPYQGLGAKFYDLLTSMTYRCLQHLIDDDSLPFLEIGNQYAVIRVERINQPLPKLLQVTLNQSISCLGRQLKASQLQILSERIPQQVVFITILLVNPNKLNLIENLTDSAMIQTRFYDAKGSEIELQLQKQIDAQVLIPLLHSPRFPRLLDCFIVLNNSLDTRTTRIEVYDITQQYVICNTMRFQGKLVVLQSDTATQTSNTSVSSIQREIFELLGSMILGTSLLVMLV